MAYQKKEDDPNKVDFAIFDQRNPGGSRPDEVGRIELTRPFLQSIVDFARDEGIMPVLNVAIWHKTSQKGNKYKSGKLSIQEAEYTRKAMAREQARHAEPEQTQDRDGDGAEDDLFPF